MMVSTFGAKNITRGDTPFLESAANSLTTTVGAIIIGMVVMYFMNYILLYFRGDGLEIMNRKVELQTQIGVIFENLDEAIITKGFHGVSFVNKKGFEILRNIQLTLKAFA